MASFHVSLRNRIYLLLTGILLIMIFAVYVGILPPFGRGKTVDVGFWRTGLLTVSGISHLILPATTLALYQLAVLLRLTRAGMREVMTEEYIKTAWAKGLKERLVILRHGLKNGLIPIVTLIGMSFSFIIGGSVLVENVFNIPGVGRLVVNAVFVQDYPANWLNPARVNHTSGQLLNY